MFVLATILIISLNPPTSRHANMLPRVIKVLSKQFQGGILSQWGTKYYSLSCQVHKILLALFLRLAAKKDPYSVEYNSTIWPITEISA